VATRPQTCVTHKGKGVSNIHVGVSNTFANVSDKEFEVCDDEQN